MRKLELDIPTSWKELTNKQLLYVSALFQQRIPKHRILTKAFLYFTGMSLKHKDSTLSNGELYYFLKKRGEKEFAIPVGQFTSLVKSCEWLVDDLTEINPLPKIHKAKAIHPRFYGVSFDQWLTALIYYNAFQSSKDEHSLDCLCATLYQRKLFKSNQVRKDASYYRKVDPVIKYTAVLWFGGLLNVIQSECEFIFQSSSEEESNDVSVNIKENILGMIRMLNGGDMTKNAAIRKAETWDALHELNAKTEEYLEWKEKNKK